MNGNCYFSDGIYPTITRAKGEGQRVAIPVEDIETNHGFNQRGVVHDVNGVSRTVMGSGHAGNEPKVAIPVLTPERAKKRQNGRRFKEDGEEAFTLTGQDRHGVAVEVSPKVIGGIGEKNFGKQYRQGNRVYDGDAIATALESHPVGNTGGNTNLYSVQVVGNIYNSGGRAGNVYDSETCGPCLPGFGAGGGKEMNVAIPVEAQKNGDKCDE